MWFKKKSEKIMKLGQFISVLILSAGATFNVLAQEQETINKVETIELFVKSGTAIFRLDPRLYPDIKSVVHVVDEVETLEAMLNGVLKKVTNEQEAKILVQPYFQDKAFVTRFQRAHLAKIQARRYGLSNYPAAVINKGEGLVSGFVDVNEIIELVNQQKEGSK